MHVRLNVPAWGLAEVGAGVAARVLPGRGRREGEALHAVLAGLSDDWVPRLLCSGRAALAHGLRELGLAGKPVAVPAYACPAVWTGVLAAGAHVVRVDVQERSFRFDLDLLREAVKSGAVAGIVAANTYGADQDMEALSSLGVPVLEDAAYQAADRLPIPGTRADAGVWSFRFKALCGVAGGVLWTRAAGERAPHVHGRPLPGEWMRFTNYAGRSLFRHRAPKHLGGALRPARGVPERVRPVHRAYLDAPMSGLQAAIVLRQWRRREDLAAVAAANRERLALAVEVRRDVDPMGSPDDVFPHVLPMVHVGAPDRVEEGVHSLRLALHAAGVQTEDPYPVEREHDPVFPNAVDLARRLLLVPCGAGVRPRETDRIATALTGGRG